MKSFVFILAIFAVCNAEVYHVTFADLPGNRATDFIKGFIEGLNQKGDVNQLLDCIKGIENVIDNIIEGLELILTKKADNIIIGITKIVKAVREILAKIEPCAEGFDQIKKLIEALKHIDIIDIALKFLENPEPFVSDIVRAVEAFKNKDFLEGGKRVGSFLYKLFLTKTTISSPVVTVKDVFDIIEGVMNGLNPDNDVDDILNCANKLPIIASAFTEAIDKFEKMDWNNHKEIIEGFLSIIAAFRNAVNTVKPCIGSWDNVVELVKKIISINFAERLQKMTNQIFTLIDYITKAGQHFKEAKFFEFGTDVGAVLYTLLLKKIEP